MDIETRRTFEIIFQEAHVVDLDFSQWDRRLRLVVSAGLVDGNFSGRGLLHNVDFRDVASLRWTSNHLDVELDTPDQHCQWVIMEFDIEEVRGNYVVALSGFAATPSVEIECRAVELSTLDPRVVDFVNPDWNRPYQGLARPGLEKLWKLHRRR